MMDVEEQELRALSEALAAAGASRDEPRSIVAAYRSARAGDLQFTMQAWIDLEDLRSSFLRGAIPDYDDLEPAAQIFGVSVLKLTPEEAIRVAVRIRDTIAAGFAMALPMHAPGASGAASDGFGSWLPLLSFLEAECGKSFAEASAYPVGRAFALLAATRRNQGWETQHESYAQRDVLQKEAPDA